MTETGGSNVPSLPPSAPRECRSAAGYDVCFYPGIVRKLSVAEDGIETPVYEQERAFVLPPGQLSPWPSHTLELRGNGREMVMQLFDPNQQIERVEIVLKPRGEGRSPERLILDNGPVLCPPFCPEITPG